MVAEVTPEEVKSKLDDGATQLIDIRPEQEFETGHIPTAINLPMAELPSRVAEVDWADDITVVCPIGESSIQAARLIGSYEGVEAATVSSMRGGYEAWEHELTTAPSETAESR